MIFFRTRKLSGSFLFGFFDYFFGNNSKLPLPELTNSREFDII